MADAVDPGTGVRTEWHRRLMEEEIAVRTAEEAHKAKVREETALAAAREGVLDATHKTLFEQLASAPSALIGEFRDTVAFFGVRLLADVSGLPLDTDALARTVLSPTNSTDREVLGTVVAGMMQEVFNVSRAAEDHANREGTGGSALNLEQFFGLTLRVAMGSSIHKLLPAVVGSMTPADFGKIGDELIKSLGLQDAGEELYEALIEYTVKAGMEKELLRKIKPTDLAVPEALQAHIEGQLTESELAQVLNNGGIRDDIREIMIKRAGKSLTLADITEMLQRGLITNDAVEPLVQGLTYGEDERFVKVQLIHNDRLWKLRDQLTACYRTSYRSGITPEATLRQWLGAQGYTAAEVDTVIEIEKCKTGDTRSGKLTDSDLDFAIDAGCLPPGVALDYLVDNGMMRSEAAIAVAKMIFFSTGSKKEKGAAVPRKIAALQDLLASASAPTDTLEIGGLDDRAAHGVINCLITNLQETAVAAPEEEELKPPTIRRFTVSPPRIVAGQEYAVTWEVTGSDSVTIEPLFGEVSAVGSLVAVAETTQQVTLIASGPGGTSTRVVSLVALPKAEPKPKEPALPKIREFRASPSRVTMGDTVELSWRVEDADTVNIFPAPGPVPSQGVMFVTPLLTTTYSLVAQNLEGSASRNEGVLVRLPDLGDAALKKAPVVNTFSFSPSRLQQPGMVELRWRVTGSEEVAIEPLVGNVPAEGSRALNIDETTTFRLTAQNDDGDTIRHDTVIVLVPPEGGDPLTSPPVINEFSVSPSRGAPGTVVEVKWRVSGADTVTISPEPGPVESEGVRAVTVSSTTTFQLVARGQGGFDSRHDLVIISQS